MPRRAALVLSLLAIVLAGPAALCLLTCGEVAPAAAAAPTPVERGSYLVRTMACADCHTPWILGPDGPEPDAKRWLSGHPADVAVAGPPPTPPPPWGATVLATNTAWAGPWGVSFTANLTPDRETGLGAWTADDFGAALRTGRHQGRGRPIQPPMPWFAYKLLTDDDLNSIFAYLQSLPPIRNRVPAPIPPAAPEAAR